jgi:hypothetical protein
MASADDGPPSRRKPPCLRFASASNRARGGDLRLKHFLEITAAPYAWREMTPVLEGQFCWGTYRSPGIGEAV